MKATTGNIFYSYGILTLALLCLFTISHINAQNFSNLQDKDLNRIDDVAGAITGLISSLDGKIDKVTVLHDSEKKLKVSVSYTGLEKAFLSARILGNNRNAQQGISRIEMTLEGKTSPLELEFNLSETLPEGTELSSPFLEFKLAKSKNQFVKTIFLYNLNKNWKTEINPENLIIPITLEPVGSASNLKESTQTIVLPQKKPKLKYTFDASKLQATTLSRTAVRPSTTTTAKNKIDGIWINTNKNTRSITKIIVSNNGRNIQVFGKCSPKDCDWGKKPLTPLRSINTYRAIFPSSVATSTFTLKFGDKLEATQNRVYKSPSRGTKTSVETFSKQLQVSHIATLPVTIAGTRTSSSTPTKEEEKSKEPEGPDNSPISLWEDLVADNDFEFPYEITNIRMDIYPDKNLASGVFYYLPTAYHLRWNTDEGYNFRMLYGTAEENNTTGNVRMTGTLTPGISSNEVALMKSLLESYVKDNPIYTYTELKIIPLKSTPTMSLSSGLEGQYDIPEDKINVTISSSITNPIDVSWVTDNKTKEEMQVALTEGVGIKGLMTLAPDSDNVPEQLIPVRITLADERTLGRFALQPNGWRDENWKNNTPFPLRLKNIHALIIEKQGHKTIPLIYTWDLHDVEVPAMANVNFDASKMPKWIETKNKTERIWLEYNIVDCSSCVNSEIEKLTDGTTNSKVKNITFESFKIFDSTNYAFLKIRVRSIHADPKGETMVELPSIRITEDMSIFSTGPIYLPEGAEPQFEYFFTLVTEEGISHNSENWMTSNETEVFIGMHSLTDSIKALQSTTEDDD